MHLPAIDAALSAAATAAALTSLGALMLRGTWRESPAFVAFLVWTVGIEILVLERPHDLWTPEAFVVRQAISKGAVAAVVLTLARATIAQVSARQWRQAGLAALVCCVLTLVFTLAALDSGATWHIRQYRAVALFGVGTVALAGILWFSILYLKIPTHPVREAILATVTVYPIVQSVALVAYERSFPIGDALQRVASLFWIGGVLVVADAAWRHAGWQWMRPPGGAHE